MQKLAFIFPGQGSQAIGMLAELAEQYSIISQTFAEASAVLGYDLWQLCQFGPEPQLHQTEFTQPALLAASIAVWRVWLQQQLPQPIIMAGHSLGEYSALVCAGALDFVTAIKLVAARGRYMQNAADDGAMAAIVGLEDDVVSDLCIAAAQNDIVAPANFNAFGQVVIAGHAAAVDRVIAAAKQQHAKLAKRLSVSVPSHCELMYPAAKQLEADLATVAINTPKCGIIHNVDVQRHADANAIKTALLQQLYNPVRWVETIQQFALLGITHIIECGPGKVLTGLNKRITPSIPTWPIYDLATFDTVNNLLSINTNTTIE